MTDEVIPHFHNDLGVQFIEIGAKKFMCMGALPPQDHPHVFCDMGEDVEYVCPYCSTLYRHNHALAPNKARPAECEFHDVNAVALGRTFRGSQDYRQTDARDGGGWQQDSPELPGLGGR